MSSTAFISGARRSSSHESPFSGNVSSWCLTCDASDYDLDPITVEVRIIPQLTSGMARGTCIMHVGALGLNFWSESPPAYPGTGEAVINSLRAEGYRIVETEWSSPGWQGAPPGSFLDHSSRIDALARWIRERIEGPFAWIGNSNGSSAAAYLMGTWGVDWLSLLVACSGPTFTLLQHACGAIDPAWATICDDLELRYNSAQWTCGSLLRVYPAVGFPCNIISGTEEELAEAGIEHTGTLFNYPTTPVRMILGKEDCGGEMLQALRWYDMVQSDKALRVLDNTPHWISGSIDGRTAIVAAVTTVMGSSA